MAALGNTSSERQPRPEMLALASKSRPPREDPGSEAQSGGWWAVLPSISTTEPTAPVTHSKASTVRQGRPCTMDLAYVSNLEKQHKRTKWKQSRRYSGHSEVAGGAGGGVNTVKGE